MSLNQVLGHFLRKETSPFDIFVSFGPTKNLLKTPQLDYPLVIPNIAGWNITIFDRKYIFPQSGAPHFPATAMLDDPVSCTLPPGPLSWPDVQRHILLLQLFGVIFLEITKVLVFLDHFFQGRFKWSIWKTPWEKHTYIHKNFLFMRFSLFFLREFAWFKLMFVDFVEISNQKHLKHTHTQGFAKDAWMIWIETVCIHRQVNAMCDRENPRRTGWPRGHIPRWFNKLGEDRITWDVEFRPI